MTQITRNAVVGALVATVVLTLCGCNKSAAPADGADSTPGQASSTTALPATQPQVKAAEQADAAQRAAHAPPAPK